MNLLAVAIGTLCHILTRYQERGKMFENVREDIRGYMQQYMNMGLLKKLLCLLLRQELHAVLIYRFGRWVFYECKIPLLRILLKIPYVFLNKASEILIGVGIWPESEIGPGLRIEHYGGVYIKARMGRNCRISQQVVIGHIGGFKGGGVPTLGDNVYVGAGAKVLGDIRIGNDVKIGANAVVITDVPDNAVAVGVPAVIKMPKGEMTRK